MPLEQYAKLVTQPDHWGCEVDLAIVVNETNRVWQMGRTVINLSGEVEFEPSVQLTPPGFDWVTATPAEKIPLRMVHENGQHWNVFKPDTVDICGSALHDDAHDDAHLFGEVAAPPPPKPSALPLMPSSNSLEELLHQKQLKMATEDQIREEVSTVAHEAFKYAKLSELVGKKMPINFETLTARLAERKLEHDKEKHNKTEPSHADGKKMGSGRQMRAAAEVGMVKAAVSLAQLKKADADADADKSDSIPSLSSDSDSVDPMEEEKPNPRVGVRRTSAMSGAYKPSNNLTTKPSGPATRAKKAAPPMPDDKADEEMEKMKNQLKKLEAELKAAKARKLKPAEEKKQAAILEAEKEEVSKMKAAQDFEDQMNEMDVGVEELTPGSMASKSKKIPLSDTSLRNMHLKKHLQVNSVVILSWGSHKSLMGTITAANSGGFFTIHMDNGEVIQTTLYGKDALKHVQYVIPEKVPPELMRYKSSGAILDMLVNDARAEIAEMPETLEGVGGAFAVVDNLDFLEEKKKTKWIAALGCPHKVFTTSMGSQCPLPGDYACVIKTDKTTRSSTVVAQMVNLGHCYSYDHVTKQVLLETSKSISVRVGLADYNKTLKIHEPKSGRKWVQDESVESNVVPLDIRQLSYDMSETKTDVRPHPAKTNSPLTRKVMPSRAPLSRRALDTTVRRNTRCASSSTRTTSSCRRPSAWTCTWIS